jgi:hypothetical protein
MVAVGVSVACLSYTASLIVQRFVPSLKDVLGVALEGGIHPTYYLRVAISVALGAFAAALVGKRDARDKTVALALALAIAVSVVAICAFP